MKTGKEVQRLGKLFDYFTCVMASHASAWYHLVQFSYHPASEYHISLCASGWLKLHYALSKVMLNQIY